MRLTTRRDDHTTETTPAFALTNPAKDDPALIARDAEQFAAIRQTMARRIGALERRLARELSGGDRNGDAARDGSAQSAMDRDTEVRRLGSELRLLRRFGIDLCLGRMVPAGDGTSDDLSASGAGVSVGTGDSTGGPAPEPIYIGRIGLTDDDGRRLLVDWRAPASEPFFGATHANPQGLASRRRYRWTRGRVSDYWDEVFDLDGLENEHGTDGLGHAEPSAALDDQSAFIASLGSSRSERMRDVLSTIQADQDAIIRADAHGPLVVDGGPGTGKTVVALHRAAYLLYSEPRISGGGGGVLFVGPHQAYLDYVHDVLPGLGEDSVRVCTLRDLVPEGATAVDERDMRVARLKASTRMVEVIEAAVRHYEQPPTTGLTIETPWADVELDDTGWAEAFGAVEPGTPHNEARAQVWETLLEVLIDQVDDEEAPPHLVRRYLQQEDDLTSSFAKAWPLLDPAGVVGDLWSVPAYLRLCAPWLTNDEVRALRREDARAFTVADLPLLDAARQRIGDPDAVRLARRREAALVAEREERARIAEDLIAADDSEMLAMSMLRGDDFKNALDADGGVADAVLTSADSLAGPFAHVIVDEAQELTDAQWQMLLRRIPSRSITIVGDRAQARHGFTESWAERLARVGLGGRGELAMAPLGINYRTPSEVMAAAEPVIRSVLPDANVPTSVRESGLPVVRGPVSALDRIVDTWAAEHAEGVVCVIGAPSFEPRGRIRSLSPEHVKGLEFDLVVLVNPERFGDGIEGAVDRYVAMTRATQQLVLLEG